MFVKQTIIKEHKYWFGHLFALVHLEAVEPRRPSFAPRDRSPPASEQGGRACIVLPP